MTRYFHLPPLGAGTEDVEHFHSYFYRYASIHGVTMVPMARHLEHWWNRTHDVTVTLHNGFLFKRSGLPLCGYGKVLDAYVKVVAEASGVPDLYKTTLLPIRSAADAVGHGAIRSGRAWCPACLYWSERNGDVFYDKLIWAIKLTERCSLHQVNLVSCCPHCGVAQWAYQVAAGHTHCVKCQRSLVQTPDSWVRNEYPSFGERDIALLVKAIADGSLTTSIPGSFGLFVAEARASAGLTLALDENNSYKFQEARALGQIRHMPTLSTMLKVCHLTGVKLVDVLSDPKGSVKTMGLLVADEYGTPLSEKPRRSDSVISGMRTQLIEALSNAPIQELVSFAEFAKKLDVSQGLLRYREPSLSKLYIDEHLRQLKRRNRERRLAARRELTVGRAFRRYQNDEFKSQDELVDYLHERFGCQKHVLRRMIMEMQDAQQRINALSKKARLTDAERKLLRRGMFQGYVKAAR